MGLDISLVKKEYLVDMNITHNLTPMWKKAGIYDALYNSEYMEAKDILPVLIDGLADMVANKEEYEKLNSPNGWGLYENAVPWLVELIQGCKDYPDSVIEVSR